MVDDRKQGGEEQLREIPKPKSPLAAREEEVLEFWNREGIFQKSLNKSAPNGGYVFYDGPPFATGLPHYGHLLQSAIKDAVPRYRTMRGFHVKRVWGWDCHGLPLENQIEQELGIKNKRQIEEYGIEQFNLAARNAVLRYAEDWKRIIPRMGRWVDMEKDYRTMDAGYTESVWWAFKNLYNRGLVYEGFKSMHLCPRCGTTLSNNEVALGYKDIEDYAVTVKLPLADEPDTSLLIWTTTPWTLPGNVAAAVKEDATYVKAKNAGGFVIVAKELVPKVLGDAEVVGEVKGKELVGKRYEPPFPYFKNELHKHKTHAWKVYAAPYVTLEDGTGIVHLAPAYGAEDLELAQKNHIPLIHHVTEDGRFVSTVSDFAGLPVKPKGRHLETDAKIVEWLKEKGLLFASEKITHAYPHCWRCDTPLLNWAANSWFVNVQNIKRKLVSENKKVRWVPSHVGTGRFNNGLMSAPDWAISRSRFWGAPLPVWRHSKTKEVKVVGSVDELLPLVRTSGNRYFLMRHGQARSNVEERLDSGGDHDNHLTDEGKAEVNASAARLAGEHIDLIVTSPVLRARETAALMQKRLGLPGTAVMVDERLTELNTGVFNGKSILEWIAAFPTFAGFATKPPEGGESLIELRRRVGEFLFEIEKRYAGKRILIVSHGDPAWVMREVALRTPHSELAVLDRPEKHARGYLMTGQYLELSFTPYPHNENFELDLHRPYIDELPMGDTLGGHWRRVPDVFDCWFESGSMPFASHGYPRHKKEFNPGRFFGLAPKGYPADFIAESIDQTRGWFYSLMVLGVALFSRSPYQAVVTNGLVLAEDGRKMSKKLKNYPDPMELVERYGADALRYYLLSSAVIRGEDLRFSARGVEEVSKKLLMRLDNVRSFYQLYAAPQKSEAAHLPEHVLDRWILSRLGQLVEETTAGYETYELDAATRPLMEFVDDLSTWYLRRSRERFKTDAGSSTQLGASKTAALATLRRVLMTLAQVMAPAMPFYAEYLWGNLCGDDEPESVHLTAWPEVPPVDSKLIAYMKAIRALASEGLELREKAGIKIRQPLASFTVLDELSPELADILKDELNVKKIIKGDALALDTNLTPELKEDGMLRTVIRRIQEARKEQGLTINDKPKNFFAGVFSAEEAQIVKKYSAEILSATNIESLRDGDV